ncbi:DUF4097 family beta strand repeat-containing protein [Gaopeijia maritima]|uniref:DUF4097 family beta strand repeat-containing protein n=1 Tax=Gaopeijia maritima TaxID=3119007 RepID=A0ABU9EC22_9BACT
MKGMRGVALGVGFLIAATGLEAQETHRLGGSSVAIYNLAGEVEVVRGTGSEVVVSLTRGGADAQRLSVDVREVRGRETLVVHYPADEIVYDRGRRGSYNTTMRIRDDGTWGGGISGGDRVRVSSSGSGLEAHANLRVEVPNGRAVAVFLAVGEATARGLNADVELDIGSGAVEVADVQGDVSVDTGSGGVQVSGVQGELMVDTGSGSITIDGVRGPALSVDTGSGRVDVSDVEAEVVEVDTGSGSVDLLRVSAADVMVDTGSGAVEVEVLTAVDRVEIDTGSGSITLRVPSGVNAEIEADSGSGGVDLDIPMQLRTQRRNYIRGTLGDGRGRITLDTGSGRIRVIGN